MLFFPQLISGVVAQYPLGRSRRFRTVLNDDGQHPSTRSQDAGAERTWWDLNFQGLTDAERQAVEDLALAAKGMLGTFTFLDPYDNLLRFSEDYLASVWQSDAGLTITPGVPDPYGTQRAAVLSNPTNLSRRFYQLLPVPCYFHYTFSVYMHSTMPTAPSILMGPPSDPQSRECNTHAEWKRQEVHNAPSTSEEPLLTAIELAANTEIVIFGPQLETTLVPTDYKATSDQSGVHEYCRLGSDRLQWTTSGADNHFIALSIVTTHQ
ncbi:MAG: hypothetical protein IANPNBLG_00988 [Bryobacteraceae bacterium]|nr:hypothetical protein [Bryobacteraceae bacterium]